MKEHNEKVEPTSRYFNIQRIGFDDSGYPVMELPVGYETDVAAPSGEIE